MQLQILKQAFTVCKVKTVSGVDLTREFCFFAKTDEELSLVCPTEDVPVSACTREDGWRGFRIRGVLDFSLIGVLSAIASLLAKQNISILAISTYNTDYVFTRQADFDRAIASLAEAGYSVLLGE